MMKLEKLFKRITALAIIFVLFGCGFAIGGDDAGGGGIFGSDELSMPDNAIEVTIIYAPESDLYLPEAIDNFNRSYAQGVNPVTGESLADDEQPIFVVGEPGSSGKIHQGIINAFIAPNNANVAQPVIFAPSVSHWLALVNFQTGRQVFDLADAQPTALAPVVMAIWESRLEAIRAQSGSEEIGWEELLQVMNSPNGWADYGIEGDRTTVYYGHTDPYVSSTALSTLIAEFYASTLYTAGESSARRLEMGSVQSDAVQDGVRDIEALVKHYSSRTTEFKEYIAQGPSYLDFVALEENDLIFINQGKTSYRPPEPLVALYPKEGTFWHEHPFGIVNADWVTPEQQEAAKVFTDYIRSEEVQLKVLESGFRPVNPNVPIGYPITEELGVDPNQPTNILTVPDPDVIAAVQASWQFVKKQGDIFLVVDTSGSMYGEKIDEAKTAASAFLDGMSVQNRVGLIEFNAGVSVVSQLSSLESSAADTKRTIDALFADGDTALYDSIIEAIDTIEAAGDPNDDRIRAIIVLSDGQDTSSNSSLNDVVARVEAARTGRNPVLVIPVAYGSDADISALNAIARASATKVQSGNPEDIQALLDLLSSYF
ncbi:MAG: extracellular solute-binding protein [Chloroflexota bacterium]